MSEVKEQNTMIDDIGMLKKSIQDMKQELDSLKDIFNDKLLSDEDKKDIDEALQDEKKGKLVSMGDIF